MINFSVDNLEGLVKKSNPTKDQQKVKENGHMAHNVSEEDQTVNQQSENADREDIRKTKNGKKMIYKY
jgi:hypothetical protein